MLDGNTVFTLALKTLSEQLLTMSESREFQTVGAVQRKVRSAKEVLVAGLYSDGVAEEWRWRAGARGPM